MAPGAGQCVLRIAPQVSIKLVQDVFSGQSFIMCDRARSVEG
jgi:hypothetical protein